MPARSDRQSSAATLRQRNRELSILNEIASALNSSVYLDETLYSVLAQVADLLALHTGWIWLMAPATGEPYLAASHHLPPALANNAALMEGWCYCLETFEEGDMAGAANINVVTCSRLKKLVDGTDGLRYHASIPLYAHAKKLGVLNVASPDWRELSPDDLRLLHTIGDLLSIAIERAYLFAASTQLGAAEERNRLAREIHDTLAQGLTAVALQLESADAALDAQADARQIQPILRRALALTRANLEEARRSVLDLRAAPLEGRTLPQALQQLASEWATLHHITIQFKQSGKEIGSIRPLPSRSEIGIYRIVQEALTNCIRHAAANKIVIALRVTPTQLQCSISDDGRGFDPQLLPDDRYGLIGINERAKLMGGTTRIASTPGHGTRLEITVPLEGNL